MAEAETLQCRLLGLQQKDGGWCYQQGTSWTEPTALSLLALEAFSSFPLAYRRGVDWLLSRQRSDGGWAPNDVVDTSTWVTSAAILALSSVSACSAQLGKATDWTAAQIYSDRPSFALTVSRLLNFPPAKAPGSSPWFPGTAGWVVPTSMAILALSRVTQLHSRNDLFTLIQKSQTYLLSRRCADGGWNHGGSNARSENAAFYPETTGLALLALSSANPSNLTEAISLSRSSLNNTASSEALSWLQMGLRSQNQPAPDPATPPKVRTTRDIALRLLALASPEGSNRMLSLPG